MRRKHSLLNGLDGGWTGSQRIFVTSQFYDIPGDAELPLNVLDWLAG